MAGSKKTTTSEQTTTPYAQPQMQFGLDQAMNLHSMLQGRSPFPGSTVAPFSPEQQIGLALTAQRALGGSDVGRAGQGAVTDIASGGFLGGAGDFVSQLASGGLQNPYMDALANGNPYIQQLASGQQQNPYAAMFMPTAEGAYLDPATNPAFGQGVSAINDSVGSIFERAGRTGSGANQSSVARGVADLAANIYGQERQNQLGAQNALAALHQGDVANAMGAAGLQQQGQIGAGSLFQGGLQSALSAGGLLGSDAQARLAAAGLAPGLAGMDYTDLQALLSAGGARQQQQQAQIGDQMYRHDFPYQNAIQAQQLLTGNLGALAPQMGGTQTGKTVEQTSPGVFNSIMGGLLTAGSLFGAGGAFPFMGGGGGAPAAYPYLAGGSSAPSWAPPPISLFGNAPSFTPAGGFNLGGY